MIKVLSVDNMRRSDAHTIETAVSGRELMLRAGRAVADNVEWKPPVAVVCGSGNNAGDGYVIAGLLHDRGIECALYLLEERFSQDGRYYFEKCMEKGIPCSVLCAGETVKTDELLKQYSTIVDCIFGTGFHGEIKGNVRSVIEAVNASGAYVVSVDINSGLNGDSGMAAFTDSEPDAECGGSDKDQTKRARLCVHSDLTVSIGSYKPGHYLNMAKDVMKSKINCPIGIEPVDKPYCLLEDTDLKPFFTKRPEFSNKGSYGYIALIGGSERYSGAIRLAYMANAAMRSGAGVVKVAVPASLYEIIASNVLESTLFPLSDENGGVRFVESEFSELIRNTRTLAFGMGIGVTADTSVALAYLLKNYTGRMIVDADGLTLLANMDKTLIKNTKAQLILTPHIKEFSRLTNRSTDEIIAAPVETARSYALEYGVTVLLKGPATVITDGDEVYITDAGCSGMATAGSGDVLSGILAAVCAYLPQEVEKQSGYNGHELAFSVAAGAYINGKAGELAQERNGSISMIASDTVSFTQEVIASLERA